MVNCQLSVEAMAKGSAEPWSCAASQGHAGPTVCKVLWAVGPDQRREASNDDFPFDTDLRNYDPTNGTVSSGDMYRFGGEYMAGNWELNDVDHRLWGSIPVNLP